MATSKSKPRSAPATKPQPLDIDEFEAVETQLASARDELLVLVKKSPHDVLSKFKLGLVNGLVGRANGLLVTARPIANFDQFDVDEIPSASDAVIVLGQYLAALENLRARNIQANRYGAWYWAINGVLGERRTYGPRSLEK